MKSLYSALTTILVLATPLASIAQNPRQLQPNEHALNLPGATTIEAPPAGFDPITASDDELAYNGFDHHTLVGLCHLVQGHEGFQDPHSAQA